MMQSTFMMSRSISKLDVTTVKKSAPVSSETGRRSSLFLHTIPESQAFIFHRNRSNIYDQLFMAVFKRSGDANDPSKIKKESTLKSISDQSSLLDS